MIADHGPVIVYCTGIQQALLYGGKVLKKIDSAGPSHLSKLKPYKHGNLSGCSMACEVNIEVKLLGAAAYHAAPQAAPVAPA